MQCVPHFHYINKNFFINPASIYATLFIKVGGKVLDSGLSFLKLKTGSMTPYRIPYDTTDLLKLNVEHAFSFVGAYRWNGYRADH